jgi:hemerythrin superfamily protein
MANEAIDMLKEDHQKVQNLFDQYEQNEDRSARRSLAAEAIKELKIHTVIEEEIFYPAVRRAVETLVMDEADEEHHVAKILIAELEKTGEADGRYDAKFLTLAESVRHHIKEEEGEMLPEAKKADLDWEALGGQMMRRKDQLLAGSIPPSPEERLVRRARTPGTRARSEPTRKGRSSPRSSRTRGSRRVRRPRSSR